MAEKYFATAMKQSTIANTQEYIYEVDHVIAGIVDEKTKVMTTESGEKYICLKDKPSNAQQALYYANAISFSEFKKVFKKEPTINAALQRYEALYRNLIYYELPKKSGGTTIIIIGKDSLEEAINQIRKDPEAYEEKTASLEPKNPKNEENAELLNMINEITGSLSASNLSPDELIDLKICLAEVYEEIEAAILAIDMQFESYENEMKKILSKGLAVEETQPQSQGTPAIDIKDIFSKITRTLIAQDRAVRRAVVEISRLCETPKKDYAILLTGDTGVGKTLLASLLGEYLNRPFLFIDSTQLTIPGYVGKDIEEYLWELYEDCGKDLSLAESAIVYFDEIDKKGSAKKSDISGQGVLNTLLKFIDGVSYTISKNKYAQDESVKISTNNMIILAGGAFLDVYSKSNQNHIGFTTSNYKPLLQEEPDINDFVRKGMMPKEFIARTPVIIHLDSLNMTSLKRILLEGDESALKLQRDIFKGKGVILNTQEDYIEGISQRALNSGTGGRGLNKLVLDTTWQAYEEVSSKPGVYEEVILNGETASDPSKYQLVKRRKSSMQNA